MMMMMMMMMIVQKLDFSYFFPRHFNAQEIKKIKEIKISCAFARLRVFKREFDCEPNSGK